MTKIKSIMKKISLLIILFALLNACGGGGSGDDIGESDGGGDSPPPDSGNVNGGLSGRIFMQGGWIIDIPTGRSRRVPGIVWDDYCYENNFNNTDNDFHCTISNPEIDYGNYVSFSGYPNVNGEEYLLRASGCIYGSGYSNSDCLEVRNIETGAVIGERLVEYEHINAGAKLSRDGQYYAYTHNDDKLYSKTSFIMKNKNHDEIVSITMDSNDSMPFDWGPSGEIVLAYDGALYVTPPYSLNGVKIFDLRDHPELTSPDPNSGQFTVNGIGGSVRISPDGSKVAFMLFEGGHSVHSYTPRAPWIMNIDGTDFHRLAYTPNTEAEIFGSLAWSPDGNHILTNEGYVPSSVGASGSLPGYLYAIPSDSRNVELNKDGKDGIIRLQTNYRNESQRLTYTFNSSGFWWLP
jgi:hypothetical protein